MEDEAFKSIHEKNLKRIREILEKYPVPEEFSLDISFFRVMALLDFIAVIEKNENDLKDYINLEAIKKNQKPSLILSDYILLEISSYYSNAHKMKLKGKKLPEIPTYWGKIKNYRDSGPAHRDFKYELKNLAEIVLNIMKLDEINILKIVDDFLKYHLELKRESQKPSTSNKESEDTSKDGS